MSRCAHPCPTLVFEGLLPTGQTLAIPYTTPSFAQVQLFQCPHCQSVQLHRMDLRGARIGPWTPLPLRIVPRLRHFLKIPAITTIRHLP